MPRHVDMLRGNRLLDSVSSVHVILGSRRKARKALWLSAAHSYVEPDSSAANVIVLLTAGTGDHVLQRQKT